MLWWLNDDRKLGPHLRALIEDGDNDILVSSVSVAEIAIKRSQGKVTAPADLLNVLAEEGFRELPLLATHAAALEHLPLHHRDPFDRMLVAQALTESLALASHDAAIQRYGVEVITG
ncbi:MAG: type II toxin-antitoxin system VapC family toxin [Salinibacterium sp.]|nr:type II toxin-antitoxin system VapC family toxin [Salinibacterium sp.]